MQTYLYINKYCFGLLLLFCCLSLAGFATHNRAGEITYRQLGGYRFEVTIITYTYTKSAANHYRDSLIIQWGDSTANYIPRIKTPEILPDDYQKNTYRRIHTFPGPGVYVMVMEDPNRNDGIRNIPNSVEVPFTITTVLRIAASGQGNNTPQLLNPPIDKAAKGRRFIHNPAAYDVDGDSISYKLQICAGENGEPIPGYVYPPASKEFYVNATTGDLVWDAPTELGNYNVAMLIEEWRDGVKIGKIVRDMQIEVKDTKNSPPVLTVATPHCVRCGDTLRFMVSATDADADEISLQASGGPLLLTNQAAQFSATSAVGSVRSQFIWVPSCAQVRKQPYIVVFKARDNNAETALVDEKQVSIQVIGHPPVPQALQAGLSSIAVQWTAAKSQSASSFEVYRSTHANVYTPDSCDTGLPQWLDYQKVADSVSTSASTYIDTDSSRNLSQGYTYCYRLVSRFTDGAESYASPEMCVSLKGGLPLVTHASVRSTNVTQGSIFVSWSPPYTIDTTVYKHPWNYVLLRADAPNATLRAIKRFTAVSDTVFIDTMLNTSNKQYRYALQFEATAADGLRLVGSTPASSSIFVQAKTADRRVELQFKTQTSWTNMRYTIYRQAPNHSFDSIASTTLPSFVDTTVQNNQPYVYRVASYGQYSDVHIPRPLINFSQDISLIPLDTLAPLSLSFTGIQHRCDSLKTILQWNNMARVLPQSGVVRYRVYASPCQTAAYQVIFETTTSADTLYVRNFSDTARSMSSCYYITALDASGNESLRAHDTCVYACPSYILPNIFTPNGDNQNDLFIPQKNRFVDSVNLSMYDRWGGLVFRTSNSQINWNGTNSFTHRPLTDGVFYYVCDVYERWLDCQSHPRSIVGFVHKFSDGKQPTDAK